MSLFVCLAGLDISKLGIKDLGFWVACLTYLSLGRVLRFEYIANYACYGEVQILQRHGNRIRSTCVYIPGLLIEKCESIL